MRLPTIRLFDDARLRQRYWWPALLLLAVVSYGFGFDGPHIPKIGDENVYFQITHRTAEAGHWLPLQPADGLSNTKPPLLTWQGLITTGWGKHWKLWRLRLPSLVFTLLVALLVFVLTRRLSDDKEAAYISVLCFLGFMSTFQHGRPYLTNMPETLFLFLPVVLWFFWHESPYRWRMWSLAGVSLGLAMLYKSFVLLAPLGFSLAWMAMDTRRWQLKAFARQDLPGLVVMGVIGLTMFGLWPLLDPDPGAIVQNFILGENVGKLNHGNYFSGLFTGTYPVFRIWFGHLTNAGAMALPLIALVVYAIRQRKNLPQHERLLWWFVLGFLIVYTLPAQRQENYLLPTVPALAVLLGLRWQHMNARWFALYLLPPVLVIGLVIMVMTGLNGATDGTLYGIGAMFLPVLALLLAAYAFIHTRHAPALFPAIVLLQLLSISLALHPFEGVAGRYGEQTRYAVSNQPVYVPTYFRSSYERYRFLLSPDADLHSYQSGRMERRLLDQGKFIAIQRPYDNPAPKGYRILGQRIGLRSRIPGPEVKQILSEQRWELLMYREWLVQQMYYNSN